MTDYSPLACYTGTDVKTNLGAHEIEARPVRAQVDVNVARAQQAQFVSIAPRGGAVDLQQQRYSSMYAACVWGLVIPVWVV